MSRKTLLTEAEVRQFLKLANLKSVGDARIQEMGGYSMPGGRDEDEEEVTEQEDLEMDAAPEGGEEDLEMDAELEGGEEDLEMGAEDDLAMDDGGDGTVNVDDFMDALETALEDVLGEPVSVDDEEDEEALDDEGDLGDMGGEEDLGAEPEMDMGPEEEPMMETDELVNEVAKRVAAKLQASNSKAKMVDELAERIMKRMIK